ncbi:Uncharacterised protein [Candidatus Ornithobacterium hominis]|uniref:hypothetical protein n=1 Tax=Candidatus Ornithobacterium hominis TaxID=2497989 RepID=UPI000E5B0C6D|nr:hypothetical protein [Candidatus Ornithobacterium hominis]SZD72015.1 Uncharacterised protein [Candidatus Ornithobacterium hominis]
MIKKNWCLWALSTLLFVGCSDDDKIHPKVNVTEKHLTLDFNASTAFESEDKLNRKWYVGDSFVAESAQYIFKGEKAGNYVISSVRKTNHVTDSLVYHVRVYGKFAEGVLLINSSSKDNSNGEIFFINQNDEISLVEDFKATSEGWVSANSAKKEVYLVAQKSPNYITVLDRETLNVKRLTTTSTAKNPSYLNFYNEQGVVANGSRKDRSFYFWNPTQNEITSAGLEDLTDVPAIQSASLQVGESLLLVSGNHVYQYKNNKATLFYSAKAYVSGILPDTKGGFYIATQKKDEENAQFIHYDAQFIKIETITLPDSYKLQRNGNIQAVKGNFYWQETSSGELMKYDTEKNQFISLDNGYTYGIQLTTVVKENPFTGEIFIAGFSDFITSKGIVVKLNANGELLKIYKDVGYAPVDFIFNDKSLL